MSDEIDRLIGMQAGQVAALGAVCAALVRAGAVKHDSFIADLEQASDELMRREGAQPYEQAALNGVIALLRMAFGPPVASTGSGH